MNAAKRQEIFRRLREADPEPKTELVYRTPFELLVAVVLSAQATDKGVNLATAKLYPVANTPAAIAALGVDGLSHYIRTIGLYPTKAKNVIALCHQLMELHGGEVPHDRAALEGLIGKLAARRIALDEIEQLRAVAKRMHMVQKTRRAEDYFVLNVEFHDLLARAARNNALLANYRGVVNQLDLYRRATISRSVENIPLSTREHEAIIEAVAARDEARAEALLTEHVLVSRARLHATLGSAIAKA